MIPVFYELAYYEFLCIFDPFIKLQGIPSLHEI